MRHQLAGLPDQPILPDHKVGRLNDKIAGLQPAIRRHSYEKKYASHSRYQINGDVMRILM